MQIKIVLLSQISDLTYRSFITSFESSCLEPNYLFYRTTSPSLALNLCKTIKAKWRELIRIHLEFLSIINERKKCVLLKPGNFMTK